MNSIAVIGAGTMGNGIAHIFAQNGYKVRLIDVSQHALEKAKATIAKNLDRMVAKDKIDETKKLSTLNNISVHTILSKAVIESDLAIEAVSENINLKLSIFKELDKNCHKSAILATNTSSISITHIASETERPDKVIGMHFMNPVPIMPLIEVIRGYSTSDQTCNTIIELSNKLGKSPTLVNDYPGFVSNRILMPMINEAISTLYHGVAGVAEIDMVMKLGMAHPMGPLQLADFIGLDVCLSIMKVLFEGFKDTKYAPCPLLVNMVMAGKLGVKSGEGFYDYTEFKKAEKVSSQFCR